MRAEATGEEAILRILIAHSSALVREVLKGALEREADFEVVAQAADGPAAVAAAASSQPDVAIVSVGAAANDCVETTCLITEQVPRCRTIVLADFDDDRVVTEGLSCGASGYLTSDCSLAELTAAVEAVARGETLIPPGMVGPLISGLVGRRREHDDALVRVTRLSPRERTVLKLLVRGGKTREIAETLRISPETARTHIQNIREKLAVHSRVEAASLVVGNDLLDELDAARQPRVVQ